MITNRHVLVEEPKYMPNIVRLRLHTNASDLRQNRDYDIKIYDRAGRKLWQEAAEPADIVAIPLDKLELSKQGFVFISFASNNFLPADLMLEIGEDVMVMGYPLGQYYDELYNLPIIRHGTVASQYPVRYNNNPYFLVDATLHEGTSGSPVMTKSKDSWKKKDGTSANLGSQFYLIGINARTFERPKGEQPLGLNATIYTSLIEGMTR